jgi:chromosomal replication initiator protein
MNYCVPVSYNVVVVSCLFKRFSTHYKPKNYNQIITIVCEVTGITELQIKGKSKKREIVEARQIAMVLIRLYNPKMIYKQIGKLFSNRDHSTVMYSLKTVEDLIKTNIAFRQKFQLAENAINKTIRRKIA